MWSSVFPWRRRLDTAPTTPTALTATAPSTTQVTLGWTASTDNTKVQRYVIYRNGTQIGATPSTTYTDSGLTPLTAYSYTVKAEDEAGNLSAAGNVAYTVAVSDDGTTWTTVTNGTGNRTPELVAFPAQTAQYVRVTLDEGSSATWWSIGEFYVFDSQP